MNANICLITLSCFCGHFMLDLQSTCNEVNRSAVSRDAVVASSYGNLELKLPHAFGNVKWLPPPPLHLQNSSPRTPPLSLRIPWCLLWHGYGYLLELPNAACKPFFTHKYIISIVQLWSLYLLCYVLGERRFRDNCLHIQCTCTST